MRLVRQRLGAQLYDDSGARAAGVAIYSLSDPRDLRAIRYVGQTAAPRRRLLQHLRIPLGKAGGGFLNVCLTTPAVGCPLPVYRAVVRGAMSNLGIALYVIGALFSVYVIAATWRE